MFKLVLSAILVAAVAADIDTKWAVFKDYYNKNYLLGEESVRKYIYSENMKYIDEHNALFAKGLSTYYLGENEFTDMTNTEFRSKMNGNNITVQYEPELGITHNPSLPDTVDWRTKGYVTPVKNQGQCGSGWAFSATGAMEAQHAKDVGKLVNLSESNLIDCSRKYGNHGCKGGAVDKAFKYIMGNNGIDTEASYPYEPKERKCNFKKKDVGATLIAYSRINKGSESNLEETVANSGPVSVTIDASKPTFQSYKGGVYDEPRCSSTSLNHGVLAVGYGFFEGKAYWLVKNSWGTTWGIKGYIMMSRGRSNQCGIATMGFYPAE